MSIWEEINADFSELTDELTTFVQSFDEEYTCALNADFQADNIEMRVYYSFMFADKAGQEFQEDFISRFPACSDFNLFTLSFMHELGHLETEWDMIDDTKQRAKIKSNKAYFRLHNEKIATDWAGEYLTDNHDEMKAWEKNILKILKKVLDKYPD